MKTGYQLFADLESDITELNSMRKLFDIVLQSDISDAPTNGVVKVGEDEATALYWIGVRISCQIQKLEKLFYAKMEEGRTDAPA